jgi:hypothetical protein
MHYLTQDFEIMMTPKHVLAQMNAADPEECSQGHKMTLQHTLPKKYVNFDESKGHWLICNANCGNKIDLKEGFYHCPSCTMENYHTTCLKKYESIKIRVWGQKPKNVKDWPVQKHCPQFH